MCPAPPLFLADPVAVKQAVAALHAAKKPLVIIGKGLYSFTYSYL